MNVLSTSTLPLAAEHEAAVLDEHRATESRVLAEGNEGRNEGRIPVHHFDRCDTLGTISDVVATLRAHGYRASLDWRSGNLYAERVA